MPGRPTSTKPTLATVAKAAGVSVPTASKVLSGGTDVSAGTRDRVIRSAERVGYRRPGSRPARRGEASRIRLVDLVVSNIEGTWANGILSGVEYAATAAECDVVITIARPGRDWAARLLRRPSEGAVVVLVDPTSAQLAGLHAAGIPVVIIDPISRPPGSVPSVGVTNWQGGRDAALHLLERGHRRFGVIGGTRSHLYSRARIDGFRSALDESGVELPAAWTGVGDWDRETARGVAREILGGRQRPSALFACSDFMAVGAYEAAAELGLRIPDDLSIVGFDDVPEAEWARPQLTTVHQPIHEMGAAALRMLLRLQQEERVPEGAPAPRIELATHLVVRGSTGVWVEP
ncbi:LacI family DNA-binding transcriptional regulator [Frondihabitans australicus]|nr:substrate-binding domain-containing protein [Frondihabitans australicus]